MRPAVAFAVLFLVAAFGCVGSNDLGPSSATQSADVLDFLIGDASLWPRSGSHYLNQIVDQSRREVCWLKYGNPRRFECWRWDDEYVYHETDNAVDGDTGESYHFSDGRWMPRRVSVTVGTQTVFDVPNNRMTWFTSQCVVDSARSGSFPYRQRTWFEPKVDAGGDIGVRDNIVLEYAPYDPISGRSNPERFYFARGAGWYRWQRDTAESHFLQVSGPIISMNRDVWCAG